MAKRRGHREGSIRKRADGRWEARISLPGGKIKSLYAKTRVEVMQRLTAALHDQQQGLPIGLDDRQTIEHWLTQWLAMKRPTLKASSYSRYELTIRLHIIPALGATRLTRLSAPQLQAFYATLLTKGQSPTTVRLTHGVIHDALDDALKQGAVARNVAMLVTPPRRATYEATSLTLEQAQELLEAIAGKHLEAFYTLALFTGMRRGELLALRWEDVDLAAGVLTVQHTLTWAKGSVWTLTSPKTRASRRRVGLSQTCVEALRHHRARQNEVRLTAGKAWADHRFVFTGPDGRPLRGNHILSRDFHPLLQQAGLPTIRLHDLRHSATTLTLAEGIGLKVMAARLGHSNEAMTLGRYAHVLPEQDRAAAEALELALRAQRAGDRGERSERATGEG